MSLFANLGQDPEESHILQTHWSAERHFEALRGAPKMLQPTIGVAGRSLPFCSFAWFLGFLLCIPLLLLHFVFSFPPFFFLESYHWNICILHNDTQLVILQGQHWEMLDLSRGPCKFSDVVLPAPHLWVNVEPYSLELNKWKNKEEVMVYRNTSNRHMHVCPAVVALLAGWKSDGLGGASFSFFS